MSSAELKDPRKIRYDGHPILRWHASNVFVRKDAAGNIKLDKEKSRTTAELAPCPCDSASSWPSNLGNKEPAASAARPCAPRTFRLGLRLAPAQRLIPAVLPPGTPGR
jgi:hypothetical protein